MVSFLLDNSLGAWWAAQCDAGKGRHGDLAKGIFDRAESEEEIRQTCSIPGVPLEYLRLVRTDINEEDSSCHRVVASPRPKWTPAAGTFDGWPESLSQLKILDPCCGSGHFMVAAFLMLVPMRVELEGLSTREAVDAVLRENLHGLEIDKRCVELAVFALALAAWGSPNAGGYRSLPELNVACSGLAISTNKEKWIALAGDNINLRMAMEELYKQFKDAPVLGSLINPEIGLSKGSLFELKWEEVGPLLTEALSSEKDYEKAEMGIVAQGIAKAASLLTMKYEWVVTNVPYLSFKKMAMQLKEYIKEHFPNAKSDLANVFLECCVGFTSDSGVIQTVMTQNWLFLSSYKRQREQLLREMLWNLLVKLGGGAEAFNNGPGNITNICMVTMTKSPPNDFDVFQIINVSEAKTPGGKAAELKTGDLIKEIQKRQLKNPDARIASGIDIENLLEKKAICPRGVVSGDGERWVRRIWEHRLIKKDWQYFQGTIPGTALYSGRDKIIDWSSNGDGMLRPGRDNLALGKLGVNVSLIGMLPVTLYSGNLYDQTTASIVPNNITDLTALYCYCSSKEFYKDIREIDQKLNVTPATLIKVPFDLDHWSKVAKEKYPNGLPDPYSDDPNQWIFHGHPAQSEAPLQVAVARLLGYRWPAELDSAMELSNEARAWVRKSEALLSLADEDGIVCIPPIRGEMKAEDRLENLLAAAYGIEWSSKKKSELLAQAEHMGKTLDTWLREKFFAQHCRLFQHRPFIWHIWDGLRDGFAALVNYHKFDAKLLETLIYLYLGDWISRQKHDKVSGVDGAEEKLAAAEALKKRLELILEGEAPYDIFVRWKPIEKQPIGWEPDLNDGVRLNIRPFLSVPDVGKKGSGVLRDKPNIKWTKDRGKDVESAPWYHLGPQYGGNKGDRINDHHLTLAEKRAAREAKEKEAK
jgi:type I restriction-modification system DNA methylase subunit